MSRPDNSDSVIYSRDVISAIEELESEVEELREEAKTAYTQDEVCDKCHKFHASGYDGDCRDDDDARDEPHIAFEGSKAEEDFEFKCSEVSELKYLKDLADEAEGCSDWSYGETLIRDSYFETYAQQFADDIGAVNEKATWPNNCIDWERAAEELQQDYTSVDFDGVTYWIRS